MKSNVYYTVFFYQNGEEIGFNKFYTLKGAKAFVKLTTLDRATATPEITYRIVRKEAGAK